MSQEKKDYFVAYFDGACDGTGKDVGIGAFILNPYRQQIFSVSKLIPADKLNFQTSCNAAEYLALIEVLGFFSQNISPDNKIIICGDSNLVINQMNLHWKCKEGTYKQYYLEAMNLKNKFPLIDFKWIPRELNTRADELSKKVKKTAKTTNYRIYPRNIRYSYSNLERELQTMINLPYT
mgnify:CR=1 FL=1